MAAKQAGLSLEPLHGLSITAGWPDDHKGFVRRSASCSTFPTWRPPARERVGECLTVMQEGQWRRPGAQVCGGLGTGAALRPVK